MRFSQLQHAGDDQQSLSAEKQAALLALVASDILMLNLMTEDDKASLEMFRVLVQVSATRLSFCRLKVVHRATEGFVKKLAAFLTSRTTLRLLQRAAVVQSKPLSSPSDAPMLAGQAGAVHSTAMP